MLRDQSRADRIDPVVAQQMIGVERAPAAFGLMAVVQHPGGDEHQRRGRPFGHPCSRRRDRGLVLQIEPGARARQGMDNREPAGALELTGHRRADPA